jgi:hypothetical protein
MPVVTTVISQFEGKVTFIFEPQDAAWYPDFNDVPDVLLPDELLLVLPVLLLEPAAVVLPELPLPPPQALNIVTNAATPTAATNQMDWR